MANNRKYNVVYKVIYTGCSFSLFYAYFIFVTQGCIWYESIDGNEIVILSFVIPTIVLPVLLYWQFFDEIENRISNTRFIKWYAKKAPNAVNMQIHRTQSILALLLLLISMFLIIYFVPYLLSEIIPACN